MSTIRNRTILSITFLCLAARAGLCAVPADAVAVVNGEVLLRRDFTAALVRELGRPVLETYIDWVLVEQEARGAGISIAEGVLEARRETEIRLRMRRLYENARMTPEEFTDAAVTHGWTRDQAQKEIEKSIRPEVLRLRLLAEKVLRPQVKVPDAAVRQYYDRTHGKRFAAAHIAVPDEEFARQLLGLLRVQPQQWPDLVLRFSLDRASIPSTGRLQPVPASSELGKALAEMEAGSIRLYEEKGPVLRPGKPVGGQFASDASRWHVLYLIRPIPASDRPFEEVEDELRKELYCRRAGGIIDGWLAWLHARATVVVNLSLEPRARAVLGSDIVAFVNGEPIRTEAFGSTLVQEFGRDFIGPYVDRYLVFQKTRDMGVEVPQETLEESLAEATERAFAEHAANNGMTAEQFEKFLGEGELSPSDYKARLARHVVPVEDIRAELLARQVLADDVTVTEEDLQRAYSERYGERIDARPIVLDDLPTAEAVLADARRGANFELLVRTKSVEPLAWMHRGLVRNITPLHPYYQRVKDLPVGQVTGPFESNEKHVILKVIARHSASDPPPIADVRGALVEQVRAEKIRALTAAWLEVLRAESEIEIEL